MIFSEKHQKAVDILASAYSQDFADYVSGNDQYLQCMAELAEKYVNSNIPICEEESTYDLALCLVDNTQLSSYEEV